MKTWLRNLLPLSRQPPQKVSRANPPFCMSSPLEFRGENRKPTVLGEGLLVWFGAESQKSTKTTCTSEVAPNHRLKPNYHSYSPVALWKTYSRLLTVRTPSLSVHFLISSSLAMRRIE